MAHHIYLSVIPESLVVSMLPPVEFGSYLAVGTKKRASEQAMFFELKDDFRSQHFDLEKAIQQCVPHDDGQPKHSVYVSIYRVLERVPLDALGSLWLITRDGRPLELNQGPLPPKKDNNQYLYQELCPVYPLVASTLDPVEFCKFITNPEGRISVPKIFFHDLQIKEVAPEGGKETAWAPPFKKISHLRDCLLELTEKGKITKTVDRIHFQRASYCSIKSGFYIGSHEKVLHYPFPSAEEMNREHHQWWRSAELT